MHWTYTVGRQWTMKATSAAWIYSSTLTRWASSVGRRGGGSYPDSRRDTWQTWLKSAVLGKGGHPGRRWKT